MRLEHLPLDAQLCILMYESDMSSRVPDAC